MLVFHVFSFLRRMTSSSCRRQNVRERRDHVTCQLERPVQSRHVLFPPMVPLLILTNSRQSSSGRSTSQRQHNITSIYHDKHLTLFICNVIYLFIPNIQISRRLHLSAIHYSITDYHSTQYLITFIRDTLPPTRINTLIHTLNRWRY
jgi:hypothetical protein